MKAASIAKASRVVLAAMICFSTGIDHSIAMNLSQPRNAQRPQAPSSQQALSQDQQLEGQLECLDCDVQSAMVGMGRDNNQRFDDLRGLTEGLLQNVNVFAGANGKDKRTLVNRTGHFAPIGKLLVDLDHNGERVKEAMSTAFMISPCYVHATRHGVMGNASKPDEARPVIKFSVGQGKSGRFKYENLRATIVAHGPMTADRGDDWAILKLENCVGRDSDIGWMEYAIGAETYSGDLSSAGYPGDHNPVGKNQLVSDKCKLLGRQVSKLSSGEELTRRAYLNFCGNPHGNSGAPLFKVENGIPQVLAVQATFVNGRNGLIKEPTQDLAAVAGAISGARRAARELVTEDVMAFGAPNPLQGKGPALANRNTNERNI